jgi:hypothetical protein
MQGKTMIKTGDISFEKYGTVHIFENDSNKSKFDSGGN